MCNRGRAVSLLRFQPPPRNDAAGSGGKTVRVFLAQAVAEVPRSCSCLDAGLHLPVDDFVGFTAHGCLFAGVVGPLCEGDATR